MNVVPPPPALLSVSIVLHDSSLEMLQRVMESVYRAAAIAHASACVQWVRVDVLDNSPQENYRLRASELVHSVPRADFFRARYCELASNRGFGAGHNSVIMGLDSDFHLVLNPDAELAPDALKVGISRMQRDPDVALLSPRVTADDGSQEFLCKRYPSVLVLLLRAFGPNLVRKLFRRQLHRYEMRDACSGAEETDVLLASGCFMLVRTAALQVVGGFSDDYFLYFEDFDLSIRLQSQGRLVYAPTMQIVHHGGYAASKGRRHLKYFVSSGVTFFRQHGWRWI